MARQASATARPEEWWVVEPPRFTLAELVADLQERWRGEFDGVPLPRKLAFTLLRLIQHAAYRVGYGRDRVRAFELPARGRKFTTMELNLKDIEPSQRLHWVQGFLGQVNSGGGEILRPPRSVIFELSHACNFDCVGCGIGREGIRSDRFMPVTSLRRYAADLCSSATHLRINGLGEATLHPELDACLDVLAAYSAGREVISNFSAPLDTYVRLLGLGFVVLISWDAASEVTFRAIRRGADFPELLAKLPWLAERAAAIGAVPPILLFTLRPENIGELKATVEMGAERGVCRLTVNVFMLPDHSDWTSQRRPEILAAFDAASEAADRLGVELVLPDHLGEMPVRSAYAHRCSASACAFPRTQLVVRWNGDLTPCNMMNPYCYGNLEQRSFGELWNSPEARCFRENANTDHRHPWCRGCYYVDPAREAAT
jgi:radical SAM protein with 4Fe4S-binding SPASM domain